MELEMQSLREAFARKIAETELACERMLQERSTDQESWFKNKKVEVAKIRAGVVVMQALFERRKKKFTEKLENDKASFEAEKTTILKDLEASKAAHADIVEELELQLKQQKQMYLDKIAQLQEDQRETEARAMRAEQDLVKSDSERKRLLEIEDSLRSEVHDLKQRLYESEKREELQLLRAEVERLENELRRTKKKMEDRKNAEADALRKELMDYVKFIVRILPEDWRAQLQPQLMQRLSEQSARGSVLIDRAQAHSESPGILPALHQRRLELKTA